MRSSKQSPATFVVIYAKFIDDKEDGIYLEGVHFGGIATSAPDADDIARDCVNTIRGGTVMPKVVELTADYNLKAAMLDALAKFVAKERQMILAEDIMNRNKNKG